MTLQSFQMALEERSFQKNLHAKLNELFAQSPPPPFEEIIKHLRGCNSERYAPLIVQQALGHNIKLIYALLSNPILSKAVTSSQLKKVGSDIHEAQLRVLIAQDIKLARSISVGQLVDWAIQFEETPLIELLIHSKPLIEALDPYYIHKLASSLPHYLPKFWTSVLHAYQSMSEPRKSFWMKGILSSLATVPAFSLCLERDEAIFKLAHKLQVEEIKLWAFCCFNRQFESVYGSPIEFLYTLNQRTLAQLLDDYPNLLSRTLKALDKLKKSTQGSERKRFLELMDTLLAESIAFRHYCMFKDPNRLLDLIDKGLTSVSFCVKDSEFIKRLSAEQLFILFRRFPSLRKTLYLNQALQPLLDCESELIHDLRFTGEDYIELARNFFSQGQTHLSILCCKLSAVFQKQPTSETPIHLCKLYLVLQDYKKAMHWLCIASRNSKASDVEELCSNLKLGLDNTTLASENRALIIKTLDELTIELGDDIEEDLILRMVSLNLESHSQEFEYDLSQLYANLKPAPLLTRSFSDSHLPTLRKQRELAQEEDANLTNLMIG